MKTILITLFFVILVVPMDASGAWEVFYFPEGGFSLSMPNEPSKRSYKVKAAKGLVETFSFQSCLLECEIGYTATFADFGINSNIAKNPEEAMEFAKSGAQRSTNGKLTFEAFIKHKDIVGKEHKFSVETHQGLYVLIQRVFLVDGRIYEINVSTPIKYQFMPEHNIFLDSLKIGR